MKSQFVRTLQQFLEKESISVDSGIVNYITYRLAGIQLSEKDLSTGFYFRSNYSHYSYENSDNDDSDNEETSKKEDDITFSLPALNLEELHRMLKLFNISPDAYKINKPLTLDNPWLLNNFLPQFIEHFEAMKKLEPQVIAKYKIASAPILESTAKTTITTYSGEARTLLLADKLTKLSDNSQQLFNTLSVLTGRLEYIEQNPHLYEEIPKTFQIIDGYKSIPEVKSNKDLVSKLNMIQDGIKLYERYNRNESVLALMAFKKEFKAFLANYRISTEVEGCNILEEVILDLAEAKQNSKSPCTFNIGYDPSRFTLKYDDINKENIQKVIDCMLRLGDETVCEGYGGRHYGSVMAESASAAFCVRSVPKKKIESHSIEMDGKFFYEKVLPLVKDRVLHMAQEKLAEYQEISKEKFPVKLPKVTPVSMFQEEKAVNTAATCTTEMHHGKRLRS